MFLACSNAFYASVLNNDNPPLSAKLPTVGPVTLAEFRVFGIHHWRIDPRVNITVKRLALEPPACFIVITFKSEQE
jgi:hypothetical protein